MIVAILNQKGGTSKTTLAVNIARCLTKSNQKTLLVDSDPQGSALAWHEHTHGDLLDMTCLCKTTLDKDILKYKETYKWILIDGVPNVSHLTGSAVKCADIVLIPTSPSAYDVWSTGDVVKIVKDRQEISDNGGPKAFFVITRKMVNTNISKSVHEKIAEFGIPAFEASTCHRVAYLDCLEDGLTVLDGRYHGTQACEEIEAITKELEGICL